MSKKYIYLIFTLLVFSQYSFADTSRVDFNGFANLGYIRSDSKVPFDTKIINEDNFSYLSSAGLNASAALNSEWSVTLQLLGHLIKDDYKASFDWALVKYQPNSNVSFLIGKQMLPAWLISDHYDIGFLYPWPVPPSEIYRFMPLKTFSGAGAEFSFALPLDLRTLIQLYSGVATGDAMLDATTTLTANAKTMTGASVEIEHNLAKLRVSYASGFITGQNDTYSDTLVAPGTYARTNIVVPFDLGFAKFFSLGALIDHEPYFAMAEYARATTASAALKRAAGYYATIGYKFFNGSLMPYLHFSENTEVDALLAPGMQRAKALGLNYLASSGVKLKAEWQTVETSNGNSSFDADPKRPVNFLTLAVSTVF